MAFNGCSSVLRIGVIYMLCLFLGQVNCSSVASLIEETIDFKGVTIIGSNNGEFMGHRIINRIGDVLYIGGSGQLLTWNITSGANYINKFPKCLKKGQFLKCEDIYAFPTISCQNYIRIAESYGSQLLVCGTNAGNPQCYYCKEDENYALSCEFDDAFKNGTELNCDEASGVYDGQYIAPLTWDQNSTASSFTDASNTTVLFEGIYDEQKKSKPFIRRWSQSEGAEFFNEKIETHSNARSVNEADFVGKPYATEDHVYFFYREIAVECINQGKFVYSRVARVCKNDTGSSAEVWASFAKARLNCSLQGNYPFYFNYIRDVFVQEDSDETYFHAVFTTTPSGPPASAICTFKLSDIETVFENSNFKGPEDVSSLWLPITTGEPANRIGKCGADFSSQQVNFLRDFPLLNDLVRNFKSSSGDESDPPHFYMNGIQFTQLVRDFSNGEGRDVFYVGTSTGTILKAYSNGSNAFRVFAIQFDNTSPITGLEFANDRKTLIVTTEHNTYSVPVGRCSAHCMRECNDFLYPYCEWNDATCSNVAAGGSLGIEAVTQQTYSVRIFNANDTIQSCPARVVGLTCEAYTNPMCTNNNDALIWKFKGQNIIDSGLGHLMNFTELTKLPNHKVTHLSVIAHENTEGTYTCEVERGDTLQNFATVELTLDKSSGCLTQAKHEEWEIAYKMYSEVDSYFKDRESCNERLKSKYFMKCSEC